MTPQDEAMRGIDAELIAKVLDGRATADERARVLARADESPELLALLADSAAGMEVEDDRETLELPRHRTRWIARAGVLTAIAAAIAFAVVIPGTRGSRSETPALSDAPVTANSAMIVAAGAGAPFGGTRGGSVDSKRAQSVRIGTLVTDYAVLTANRDTAAVTTAIELAAALRAIDGGSVVAAQVESQASLPGVVSAIERVVEVQPFRRGAWVELARLATAGVDSATLDRVDLRQAIEVMSDDESLGVEARSLAAELLRSMTTKDWQKIERLSGELLAAFGK